MVHFSKPSACLAPFVRSYVHLEGRLGRDPIVLPVPARTAQVVEFTFADPFKVRTGCESKSEIAYPVVVVGVQTSRRVELVLEGSIDNFAIEFQPAALHRLFLLPAAELTDRHFEAQALFGRALSELQERLREASSFSRRVLIADSHLAAIAPRVAADGVASAAAELVVKKGCLGIRDLAHSTGLGIRQFERRFLSQVGVTPKMYARIARFEAALESKSQSPNKTWTDIASELSYYDQMHMIHDFQRLSGENPSCAERVFELFLHPPTRRAVACESSGKCL